MTTESDSRAAGTRVAANSSRLAAGLGLFDATMIVMGGIVGSGIFINPLVVARVFRTPALILGAWVVGGLIALIGASIYAELAARIPEVGGQYAYLRQAYHPLFGFLYGWALLLVINAGGTAAVAVTFAKYFREATRVPLSDAVIAALALTVLTLINCLGVRIGSAVQSALMVLRIVAIVSLVASGAWLLRPSTAAVPVPWRPIMDRPMSFDLLTVMGAAMVPVLFAYGGWQTANFIAGEVRQPRKNLPLGLLLGVAGVIALYVAVNFICVATLSPLGLARTMTPASEVMRRALGEKGAALIGLGIAISALGFLTQSLLTYPRVYFAMAQDGVFFRSVAWLHPRSRVPVAAITLQGAIAIVVALSGRYEQILNYVVSMDWVFFGLSASCLFVLRRREMLAGATSQVGYRVPGHPVTTALFVAVAWLVAANTIYKFPSNTLIAVCILLAGVPVYWLWRPKGDTTSI